MAFSSGLTYLTIMVLASHVMVNDAAVRVFGLKANGLPNDRLGYRPDPYLKVFCGGTSGGKTETINDTFSPNWSKQFNFSSCKPGSVLKLEVWDKDLKFDDLLGSCSHKVSSGTHNNVRCTPKKGNLYFSYTAK